MITHMKKIALIFFVIMISLKGFSQFDTTAPYFKDKVLPKFSLLSIDSVYFTQAVLKENKNTILMLFNPDCEHCQKQTELFLSMAELPEQAQLVMFTIETQEKNKAFYDKYHLEKYPFIHFGRDYKYFCLTYFKPTTIPLLVFYNKKNELVAVKQGNIKKEDILDILK